jgi:hypothetical protein
MANNRTAVDNLHDLLNPAFKSRENPNWKALVEAIGESDQDVSDLIQEVRKQFFISTATRPYLDRLGSNLKVIRPKIVGMDDETLRRYIPILAYQPKQVKIILDQLLDIFFFREATTSFIESTASEPYLLKDGWELTYNVDTNSEEKIAFSSQDFTSISAATAEEIAASINRQASYSFAVVFDNRITKQKYVRIFSKTVGSKGSVEMVGGRANISLQFLGFVDGAGSGATTTWSIAKIGDTVTFTYTGGSLINLDRVQAGDIAIIDMPNNSGSFVVTEVNLSGNYFKFVNLFGTVGTFDHGANSGYYVRFLRPEKAVVYTRSSRAIVWEVSPGEIVIEMPATPPVVRRALKGSAHVNGMVGIMQSRTSDTSVVIDDASEWPTAGQFILEPIEEIQTHILTGSEDIETSHLINGRFDSFGGRHSYTGKTGNTLTGISPPIPKASDIFEFTVSSISRNGSNLVTVNTSTAHGISIGEAVRVYGVTGAGFNGTWIVKDVLSSTSFTYDNFGAAGSGTGGTVRAERIGIANSGSRLYLTSALTSTGLLGPYVWDTNSAFVISSYKGKLVTDVKAGNVVLNLEIETPNNVPVEQGFLIFDYGLETQEGPVRYLYKASDSTLALDPAYVFQFNHPPGNNITAIRRRGAHVMSGLGKEYPLYVSDPGAARVILQDLIRGVKSVGVFLRYIVRFPKVYYSDYDTYGKTSNPLD